MSAAFVTRNFCALPALKGSLGYTHTSLLGVAYISRYRVTVEFQVLPGGATFCKAWLNIQAQPTSKPTLCHLYTHWDENCVPAALFGAQYYDQLPPRAPSREIARAAVCRKVSACPCGHLDRRVSDLWSRPCLKLTDCHRLRVRMPLCYYSAWHYGSLSRTECNLSQSLVGAVFVKLCIQARAFQRWIVHLED